MSDLQKPDKKQAYKTIKCNRCGEVFKVVTTPGYKPLYSCPKCKIRYKEIRHVFQMLLKEFELVESLIYCYSIRLYDLFRQDGVYSFA